MKKLYIFLWIIWPYVLFGQITLDTLNNTKDMALVAREANNKGYVKIKGSVDKSGPEYDYEHIRIYVFKTSYLVGDANDLVGLTPIDTHDFVLNYSGNIADFNLSIPINAELSNYSFEIDFIKDTPYTEFKTHIFNIVAGDVFVIQGQSNAVAETKDILVDNLNKDPFIRTLGSCVKDDRALTDPNQNEWKQAIGDQFQGSPGFIGQWGLKLGNLLINSSGGVPIAIFNGSRGGKSVSYFQKNASVPGDEGPLANDYERLLHRLSSTNLADKVKAIFWAQGENDHDSPINSYKTLFLNLVSDWKIDYPNVEKVYIFQTKSGCDPIIGNDNGILVKEAQRQLAFEDSLIDIDLISTTGLTYVYPDGSNNCHFKYYDGYEGFANRLYKLVRRDFYGMTYSSDIEPPMIQEAFLLDDTTLAIDTDAISLSINNPPPTNFELSGALSGTSITGFETLGSQLMIYLNQFPGDNAKITYNGLGAGENQTNFVINNEGLELICFKDFPIDASRVTIWEGGSWSNGIPNSSKYAVVKSNYSIPNSDIEAINLTVRTTADLDFDNGSTTSITVHDKLILEGNLTIGDTESLIMYNSSTDAVDYTGTFTKIEKSAPKLNEYSVTYWSSPVEGFNLSTEFSNVSSDRIFQLNPQYNNPLYSGGAYDKYKHWQVVTGNMIAGKGYSIDGSSTGSYPNFVETVSFIGKPNNGSISVPIFVDTDDGGSLTGYDANLLGNPYSSAIDADVFIARNSSIFSGSIYFWSQQTNPESNGGEYHENDYVTYNLLGSSNNTATNNIGSGQGFMIIASQNGIITFENDMQIPGSNNQFYKSEITEKSSSIDENMNRIWLKLKNKNNLVKDILVGFFNEATDGLDVGFDALSLSDTQLKFYSLINENKYVIQGLGTYSSGKEVSLGIETSEIGNFSIEISNIEGQLINELVLLEDKLLGIIHDLHSSPYKFEISKNGEQNDRFKLLFKSKLPDELGIIEGEVKIVNQMNGFRFESTSEMQGIEVYDILGRSIAKVDPNGFTYDLLIPTIKDGSVVIINVIFDQGRVKKYKRIK